MDKKELELYQEENRQQLINLNIGITELVGLVRQQIETNEPLIKHLAMERGVSIDAKGVEVTGNLTVNTEKIVEVDNLIEVVDSLESLSSQVTDAIKDNSYAPLSEITVKNIKDAQAKTVEISNLTDLKSYFDDIADKIKNNKPIVNVTKQDVVFPTSSNAPIAVRLSDGKNFYNAIAAAIGGGVPTIKTSGGYNAVPVSNPDGSLIGGSGGLTNTELRATPVPVDIGSATVNITGPVTISSEVEVKNDSGSPIPVSGTVAVSSSALPSGASTSAKQDTGNTSLSSIDTKLTDVATQTTLALIKAKTDNIDVALSTRTKPADQQHVIVDSSALPSGASTSANQTTGNSSLSSIDSKITAVNTGAVVISSSALPSGASTGAKQDTGNASLSSIDTKLTDNATQTTLATRLSESDFDTKTGALTETAPATDTASSGLNGRLQRIAQRLTSLIALLPTSLGQKARASSLAVTLSSEDVTALTAQSTPPSTILAFITTITTAGTRVQLSSNGCNGGVVQAPSTNSGIVYIGGSNVSASVYGAELQPGQSTGIAIDNTSKIYIDSASNGDKVAFIGS